MRKRLIPLLLALICMVGCGTGSQLPENATLTRVILERGHGSERRNHLYIDVSENQINQAAWITPEYEDREAAQVPMTEGSWQQIEATVTALAPDLVPVEEPGLLHRLWYRTMPDKLDGGAYHKLYLVWQTDDGELEIEYQWTGSDLELALESSLEELLNPLN